MSVYCSSCGDEYPDDEPMVNFDEDLYCSPNCVVFFAPYREAAARLLEARS